VAAWLVAANAQKLGGEAAGLRGAGVGPMINSDEGAF